MKFSQRIFLRILIISGSLILIRCNGGGTQGVEDYFSALLFEKSPYKDVLLERYPDRGVFSLYLQAPGLNPAAPVEQCPAGGNLAIQAVCDAEAACTAKQGNEKLLCLYDELTVAMKRYHSNREHHKHERDDSHEAWADVKRLYERLRSVVHHIRESGDHHDEEKYEEHDDEDADHHDDDGDEENDDDTLLQKIQKFYATLRKIKQKYNNTDSIQIQVEIDSIEVNHPTRGWIRISSEKSRVNLANLNLNDIMALDVLEPEEYTGVRINFGDDNIVKMLQPQSTGAAGKADHGHGDDHEDHGKHKGDDHKNIVAGPMAWKTFPLQFTDLENRSVILNDSFGITASKSTDFRFSFIIDQSIIFENNQYHFNPTVRSEGVSGSAYQSPDQPTNLTLDNGAVTIVAEPGAFDAPVNFTATPVPVQSLPAPPSGGEVALAAYDMQPSMVFNKSVSVTMKYDPATLNGTGMSDANIRVKYFNEDSQLWVDIPTFDVDPVAKTITVYTNHFTTLGAFGQPGTNVGTEELSGRLNFSALNYLLNKVLPNLFPDLPLGDSVPPQTYSTNFDLGSLSAGVSLNNISTRDLSYSITPVTGTDRIRVAVNTKNSIYYGQAQARLVISNTNQCIAEKNSCNQQCGSWSILFRWMCYGYCDTAFSLCNGVGSIISTNLSLMYDYRISNIRLGFLYQIVQDPNTNSFRLNYLGTEFGNVNGRWMDLTYSMPKAPSGTGSLIGSIATTLVTWLHDFVHGLANLPIVQSVFKDILAKQIRTAMGTILADSPPVTNFQMDELGLSYRLTVPLRIDTASLPGNPANCSTPLNFPLPASSMGTVTYPSAIHLGVALPMSMINRIFVEMANRGTFCQKVSDPVGGQLSIEPSAAPSVHYVTNHIFRMSIPVKAQYAVLTQTKTYAGNIHLFLRLKINPGLNQLSLVPFKVTHNFTGVPLMTTAMNTVSARLTSMHLPPLPLNDPTHFAEIHRSMYRIRLLEEVDGMFKIGLQMEGLKIDYGNQNRPHEWVWTKNWRSKSAGCGPFMTGTLLQRPSAPFFVLSLDNGTAIRVVNRSVYSTLFSSVIGTRVSFSGACSWGTFYADNILNDHFYTDGTNGLLNKSNHPAQLVDDYAKTIGLYAINFTGNDIPEILQIRETAPGTFSLDWYPENSCCSSSATDVVKYSMPLTQLDPNENEVYRVSVLKPAGQYNQLLINCRIYSVQYGGAVQLSLIQDFCQDETAVVEEPALDLSPPPPPPPTPTPTPVSVGQLSGAVRCSQIVTATDESVGLYWSSTGGASTYYITYSIPGTSIQNVPVYSGPAQITRPFYGVQLPEGAFHPIDLWPGVTIRYTVTGSTPEGMVLPSSSISVTLLKQQEIFASNKSKMCYFWPDHNTNYFGPLF